MDFGLNELKRWTYIQARTVPELFEKLHAIELPCALHQVFVHGNSVYGVVKFDRNQKIERKIKKITIDRS